MGRDPTNLKGLLQPRAFLSLLNNNCQAKNRFFGEIEAITLLAGYSGTQWTAGVVWLMTLLCRFLHFQEPRGVRAGKIENQANWEPIWFEEKHESVFDAEPKKMHETLAERTTIRSTILLLR